MTPEKIDILGKALLALGVLLVVVGGVLLAYLGVLVFQVINAPEDVKLVQFVLKHVEIGERAIYGVAGDNNFEINLGAPVRTVLFLFIGVLVLTALASILKALISGGIAIIRLAMGNHEHDGSRPKSHDSLERTE